MRQPYAAMIGAAVLALALAGCGGDEPSAEPGPPVTTPAESPTDAASPSDGPAASGGTETNPAPVAEVTDLLDWKPVPGSVDDTVVAGGGWTIRVPPGRTTATLDGPDGPQTIRPPKRFRVSDALLDGDFAVVVAQDSLEELPAKAYVVPLAGGKPRVLDGEASPPTVNGGSWAIGEGRLLHATTEGGRYCLAERDLQSLDGRVVYCAEQGHGFNKALLTEAGLTLMAFDDKRPSCRRVALVTDGTLEDVADTACHGWDALQNEHGRVWTVVPKETEVEAAHAYARTDAGWWDLGAATSGTLIPCGDAAYFTRDPQGGQDPARLLRWDGSTLTVVYESPGRGEAFLTSPRCGGDAITVSAFTESGDAQVTAPLE